MKKAKTLGRPPRRAAETRTRSITLHVRAKLEDQLRKSAAKSGRTLSDELELMLEERKGYELAEEIRTLREANKEMEGALKEYVRLLDQRGVLLEQTCSMIRDSLSAAAKRESMAEALLKALWKATDSATLDDATAAEIRRLLRPFTPNPAEHLRLADLGKQHDEEFEALTDLGKRYHPGAEIAKGKDEPGE
jgi:hypothetical protein